MTAPLTGGIAKAAPVALPRLGYWLLLATCLGWGLNWPVLKTVLGVMPVLTFRATCLIAGGILTLAAARASGLSLRVPLRQVPTVAAVGFLNMTVWNVLTAYGLTFLPAGRASILAFTMPLWATIISITLLGERLTGRTALGLTLGMVGLATLIAPDWPAISHQPLGVLAMLGAAMSWAGGTVALKTVRWQIPTLSLAGWQMLLGGIPVVLAARLVDGPYDFASLTPFTWLCLFYIIALAMSFCTWSWFRVIQLFPASTAAMGSLMVPVIGVVSGAVLLGEAMPVSEILALALVCGGLAIVLIQPKQGPVATAAQ